MAEERALAPTDRRSVLATIAATLLIAGCSGERVWAKSRPADLDQWVRDLVDLKHRLVAGQIGVLDWQQQVEALNTAVPVAELVRYLDIHALTAGFGYESDLADIADPVLPPQLVGPAGMRGWFVRVFGMRRGGAIIPHVHNGMVSSHLVIGGSFHARTHDRVEDVAGGVRLRPTRDGIIGVGDIISMSDRRDNQHWLVAQQDASLTFDVGIVNVPPSWDYGHAANAYHMIHVDPTVAPETDGSVIAPIIDFDAAQRRFAPG
jgi:hypothetical protein